MWEVCVYQGCWKQVHMIRLFPHRVLAKFKTYFLAVTKHSCQTSASNSYIATRGCRASSKNRMKKLHFIHRYTHRDIQRLNK